MAQISLSFCHRFKNKIFIAIFIILTLIVFTYYTQLHAVIQDYKRKAITEQFRKEQSTIESYREIAHNEQQTTTEEPEVPETAKPKVFFIETTFESDNGEFNLNARQACSVESAARANPNMDVVVQFASKTRFKNGE
jgi:hypothetical protein